MSRGFASNYRIVLVATGLFLSFGGVGARLVWLHVVAREDLLRQIVRARRQVIIETAQRGDIRDRNGHVLATSVPRVIVAFDPLLVRPEDEAKWSELATLLKVPLEEVRRKLTTKYRFVTEKASASTSANVAAATGPVLKLNLAPCAQSSEAKPVEPDAPIGLAASQDQTTAIKTSSSAKTNTDDDEDVETDATSDGRRAIRWIKLSDNVSESTYNEIKKLGVHGLCPPERRFSRVYPQYEMAAHLVGFANHEGKGVAGIEAYADFYLRGQDGWREGERDGHNRELAQFQTREASRSDGYSVTLSIDSTVQYLIERELDRIAKTYQPLKATIIVSNPSNGFILGMANYPSFDPNEYGQIPPDQMSRLNNVAVSDMYEPGSVFKIVAASGALQEGLVTPDSRFDCSIDHIMYHGRDRGLPREDHHFGMLTVADIVSHSSNRGAAQLAMAMGDEKFYAYARAFGFGEKLGFPVGGEIRGTVHPAGTQDFDITRMPMGQSVTATALQMHQAMATIANGGVLMRPQIIKEIRDASKSVVYSYAPTEIRRAISANTARTMAHLLQRVASVDGTAPGAAIKLNGVDYEVAGKTGTAQKYVEEVQRDGTTKLKPSDHHHVVSFVGFFPASRPQVAISVIVDDADAKAPNGVAYGAAVAAPVFKSIGEKLIPILSITPPNQPARVDFVAATEGGLR
jgi:cell division protein FtsI (penicillin-binding protein 3)